MWKGSSSRRFNAVCVTAAMGCEKNGQGGGRYQRRGDGRGERGYDKGGEWWFKVEEASEI